MDGIINIDKPAGITSYGVVARIKRMSGEKRVGHAGTLDPDATGVLPVCLGKATRVVQYLSNYSKTYHARIELGTCTDTYDASGEITQRGDASQIDRGQIESALKNFKGDILQTPPMYSALKHRGQPLYKLARAGVTIERKSRTITIHNLKLIDYQLLEFTLEIECSKGTYIRSLANDLGQSLGCGAYLKSLQRTGYGVFNIEGAVVLSSLNTDNIQQFLQPVDIALQEYPSLTIDKEGEKAMRQGKAIAPEKITNSGDSSGRTYRAYGPGGAFVGLLKRVPESGRYCAEKMFS